MIAYLYNTLPGPAWARATILTTITAATIAALFLWGFPALADALPTNEQAVMS